MRVVEDRPRQSTGDVARATADAAVRSLPGVRVGCDVQSVADVDHALQHFGTAYLDRLYTTCEQQECLAGADFSPSSLAGRFAAKEAVLKLLGTAEAIDPRHVEILGNGGRPVVHLSDSAAELADQAHITAIDLSISHDGGLAFAVAVAELPASHLTIDSSARTTTTPAPLRAVETSR